MMMNNYSAFPNPFPKCEVWVLFPNKQNVQYLKTHLTQRLKKHKTRF